MGHDHHFLSRLDRVSRDQVDFALELYRDHAVVGWILTRANVPKDAERVALSIDADGKGPHVIVQRGGHFVTCLGAGMTTGDLPVLSRGKIDALAREYKDHLSRKALRDKIVEERRAHGASDNLFERLLHGGIKVSREEFVAMSAFAPLLTATFAGSLARNVIALHEHTLALEPVFTRSHKSRTISSAHTPAIQKIGAMLWAQQHMLMLFSMNAREWVEQDEKGLRALQAATILRGTPLETGTLAAIARAAWAIAKIGRVVLVHVKRAWDEADSYLELAIAGVALATMAVRHSRLEGEIKKTLGAPPKISETEGRDAFAEWMSTSLLRVITPEFLEVITREKALDARIEEDLGAWILEEKTIYEDLQHIKNVMAMVPLLGRAEAEHLYLPREKLGPYSWGNDETCSMLAKRFEAFRTAVIPEKKENTPRRQGPCPCGSGKKYKRCCGETRA